MKDNEYKRDQIIKFCESGVNSIDYIIEFINKYEDLEYECSQRDMIIEKLTIDIEELEAELEEMRENGFVVN